MAWCAATSSTSARTSPARQTYVNARLARSFLRAEADVGALLNDLGGGAASDSVLRHEGEWYSTSVDTGPDSIPRDLLTVVGEGKAGHQRYHDATGELRLAVGVPVAATGSLYFELFPLDELDRTLGLLSRSLVIGVAAAAVAAAGVGRAAAARLVRPLGPVADAAERIAERRARHAARPTSTTRTCGASRTRSTPWPRRSRRGSSARRGSPPTSATSCDRR